MNDLPDGFGPAPLIVGTTGHRELHPDDLSGLRERVATFFQGLQTRYSHTPLVLLSALAEGADRLVARAALDLGIALIVPLPLELSDYELDFDSDDSRAEFRRLLSEATHSIVMDGDRVGRSEAYRRLAMWLAHHSQIVVALWDGVDNYKPGGTAEVVRLKRNGIPDASQSQPIDPADTGPVHVIYARRANDPPLTKVPAEETLYPENYGSDETARRILDRICSRTEEFNRDAVHLRRKRPDTIYQSIADMLSGGADHEERPEVATTTANLYAYADALATQFRIRTLSALTLLFVLVFIAVAAFALFAHELFGPLVPQREAEILFAYVGPLLAATLLHQYVANRRFQDRYLDCRALAEGLRVEYYWQLTRINESAADRYLSHQRDELDWIRNAIRSCELRPPDPNGPADQAALNLALDGWIERQRRFFETRAREEEQLLHRIERSVDMLVIIGLLSTIFYELRLMQLQPLQWLSKTIEINRRLIVVAIALPAAVAALLHGYAEKRALASHVKRYDRIRVIFENAGARLRKYLEEGNDSAARAVLRELGNKALEENSDWVMLHRERPLEVPQPG